MQQKTVVKQSRVAKLLRNMGWQPPLKTIYRVFEEHHKHIPYLNQETNPHGPKRRINTWYWYDANQESDALQAEKVIAKSLWQRLKVT